MGYLYLLIGPTKLIYIDTQAVFDLPIRGSGEGVNPLPPLVTENFDVKPFEEKFSR